MFWFGKGLEGLGLMVWHKRLTIEIFQYFRFPKEESRFSCFEKDAIPVYTEKIFEGYCSDVHGNKYQENSTVTSCCECLL